MHSVLPFGKQPSDCKPRGRCGWCAYASWVLRRYICQELEALLPSARWLRQNVCDASYPKYPVRPLGPLNSYRGCMSQMASRLECLSFWKERASPLAWGITHGDAYTARFRGSLAVCVLSAADNFKDRAGQGARGARQPLAIIRQSLTPYAPPSLVPHRPRYLYCFALGVSFGFAAGGKGASVPADTPGPAP